MTWHDFALKMKCNEMSPFDCDLPDVIKCHQATSLEGDSLANATHEYQPTPTKLALPE